MIEAAIDEAFSSVAQVQRLMSFQDANSDVSRLNGEAVIRETCVDDWTYEVLVAALDLYHRSSGIFDVTAGPSITSISKTKDASSAAVELLARNRVRFHRPDIAIDLSGIAKGFAVDRAIDALKRRGIPSALVNAGGDLAAFGPAPYRVHIRDPRAPSQLLCAATVANEALASSGASFDLLRSSGIGGPVIIDPETRELVRGIAGATIRARSCLLADALTKVVMIAGETAAGLLDHYGAEALIVSAGGSVTCSRGWGALNLAA
jgi:thiamine biosynthesis lipoprotein